MRWRYLQSASAGHCCLAGGGRSSALQMCWAICWKSASSSSRWNARYSLPRCTACACPVPTATAHRGCEVTISPAVRNWRLHHFYRAMAWVGEELEEKAKDGLAPRCVKDEIEERLFAGRRDLFRSFCCVHGHNQPVVLRRGWRDIGGERVLEGLPTGLEADDFGACHRR